MPVRFLGQVKRPDRMFDAAGRPLGMRQLGVQEVDIVSIVKPITKYAVTVLDPQTIRYHLLKRRSIWRGRDVRAPYGSIFRLTFRLLPVEWETLAGFDPVEAPAALSGS